MTEYIILSSSTTDYLSLLVRVMIEKGWEPCGGVGVESHDSYKVAFYQAMIRKNPIAVTGR